MRSVTNGVLGLPSAILAFAAALSGCERPDALDYRPITVTAVDLSRSEAPAWSALVSDFDADGIEELVLAGHRGAVGPGFCRLDGSVPCQWEPILGRGADRHHCTAGDIDANGLIDFYCTAGAYSGEGTGSNEVGRQVEPRVFELVPDALGASEMSSRGRLATFFDFNHDLWPDLVTTAWGARSDGADNRTKLWINVNGVFQETSLMLPDNFGARCLATVDADGDGFVDLLGCPGETGLTLFRNDGASALEKIAVGVDHEWYWDTKILQFKPAEPRLLISSGGTRGNTFIELTRLTKFLQVAERRRISCWQDALDEDSDVFCGRLLLHDADRDGHVDILVSRRKGGRHTHEEVVHDAPDLLIFGPNFQTFTDLPPAAFGARSRFLQTELGLVQINAGENWSGSVKLLRF